MFGVSLAFAAAGVAVAAVSAPVWLLAPVVVLALVLVFCAAQGDRSPGWRPARPDEPPPQAPTAPSWP